eukprot:1786743-Pyramimonas_sp.AAC.1
MQGEGPVVRAKGGRHAAADAVLRFVVPGGRVLQGPPPECAHARYAPATTRTVSATERET